MDSSSREEVDIVETGEQRGRFCIVVVAYNRLGSLERLLASLLRARYGGEQVDLTISIDGGDVSEPIHKYALEFVWPFGVLTVRRFKENIGLRRHVLSCGAISRRYDAIIMLEDDIVVGPNYFAFTRASVDYYQHDDRLAGISLYAPSHNEMAELPFQPVLSGNSVYCLQSAQSWGQCWTREMWRAFEEWYEAYGDTLRYAPDMPDRIYSWPESSWKKFAMKYLVDTGKTWLYPYLSHTTNCSEIGTHNKINNSLYQVPISRGDERFIFSELDDLYHYDIYFECKYISIYGKNKIYDIQIVIDLYGTKQRILGPAHLITTRILPKNPLKKFGFNFKPHEENIFMEAPGDIARLYELDSSEDIILSQYPSVRSRNYYASTTWKDQILSGFRGMKEAIGRRVSQ